MIRSPEVAIAPLTNPTPPGILQVQGVTKRFGGLTAVNNVTLEVRRGEIFALIGPNGAGEDDPVQQHHGDVPGDLWPHHFQRP